MLLQELLPLTLEGFRPFPPVMSRNDALLPCQMQFCFVATLSHRECVGASVPNATDRYALYTGEVYMQIIKKTRRERGTQLR